MVAVIVISLLYAWTLCNIPIVVAGVRSLSLGKRKRKFSGGSQKSLPVLSIVVSTKDEVKVVGRLFKVLAKTDYLKPRKRLLLSKMVESLFLKFFSLKIGTYEIRALSTYHFGRILCKSNIFEKISSGYHMK
ncbi:MAG: hypothetical protein PVH73_05865 [Candidatus Bathyarchaeota archaeon]